MGNLTRDPKQVVVLLAHHGLRAQREHRDPNDRFLVATARRLNGVLLTCDEEILEYARQGHLRAYDPRP